MKKFSIFYSGYFEIGFQLYFVTSENLGPYNKDLSFGKSSYVSISIFISSLHVLKEDKSDLCVTSYRKEEAKHCQPVTVTKGTTYIAILLSIMHYMDL